MERGALVLADGTVFEGTAIGADGIATGEVVFNTSMTGYQEISSDPSYAGQIVTMTSSHIGNYGTNSGDLQAGRAWCSGLITRSMSRRDSSWRSEGSYAAWLRSQGVVTLSEVDTRRLTRHIREHGAMPAAVGGDVAVAELLEAARAAPDMEGQDLTAAVTTKEPYRVSPVMDPIGLVVAIDFGIKRDIVGSLAAAGFEVAVVPATTPTETIMAMHPTGVFLSNGPGDPQPVSAGIETVRGLLGRVPVFGICLGHQILGLALGFETYKLPFGHHGGNHPVRRLDDGTVAITAQNHGFAVDLWSLTPNRPHAVRGLPGPDLLPPSVETEFGTVRPTHQNLNDGTLEGLSAPDAGAFSVQYHPEAAPGPHDASSLFTDFAAVMERA